MGRPSRFSPEVRERAVRMVEEHRATHASEWGVLQSVAPKLGCTAETLRKWVRQAQRDAGYRPGLTTSERERLKELEREVRELKRGERDPADGVRVCCPGGARPPREVRVRFIHDHRDQYGVEPICTVLPIAPSTYHRHRAAQVDPTRRSARAQRDAALRRRFSGCMTSRIRCTGRARSGNSCVAKGAAWHDARWVG